MPVQRPSRTPRHARRWRVPPPFMQGAEPIEGVSILEEVPGAFGILLWHCARDVTLWATTPADRREGLFAPEAEQRRLAALLALGPVARELEAPLRAVAAMLSHAPDTAPEAMMLACGRVSQWAEAEGHQGTALAFAQASALSAPAAARPALRVGRLARQRGEYARAEGWLQRAIVLARQGGEREVHAWGYGALGNLYRLRGNLPMAERCQLRALRIARRHSLISREGAALHDLFAVTLDRGNHAAALRWAREAATIYGHRHPNLHLLAHDVAVLWLEQGRFAHALPILILTAPHFDARRRVAVLSNITRAAGALGDAETFESFWSRAQQAIASGAGVEHAASALLSMARGAAALGQLDRARTTAAEAVVRAIEIGEHKSAFEAEALVASLDAERRVAVAAAALDEQDELADQFAGELVSALSMSAV